MINMVYYEHLGYIGITGKVDIKNGFIKRMAENCL
jgi:hypothetical protein